VVCHKCIGGYSFIQPEILWRISGINGIELGLIFLPVTAGA
jgi:hypothetical protein